MCINTVRFTTQLHARRFVLRVFQWREASYIDKTGNVLRVYTVCHPVTGGHSADNWIRTPYIALGATKQPTRLFLDVEFSMRQCATQRLQSDLQASLQRCMKTFVRRRVQLFEITY